VKKASSFVPRPGATVGRFAIQEELARGGQGVVLRAKEAGGREVAIKLLLDTGNTTAERFHQEASVLERLQHPGLPAVIDRGVHQGVPYVAMELVDGPHLADWVRLQGAPDPHRAAQLLAEVADALHHCHRRGVVHRDLKPQNVLLCARTGKAKLVDFGLLLRDPERMNVSSLDDWQRLSQTGELKGTPAYMAPEQIDQPMFGEVGPWTDVYGLGGLLFFLLTTSDPYRGHTSFYELLETIVAGPVPDPSALRPTAPPRLVEVCKRALSRRPEGRYRSAAAMARALRGRSRWKTAVALVLGSLILLVAAALLASA
jgi:serine/threonine protein kinase